MKVQARNLASLAGISHGFFGRQGGLSEGLFSSLNVSLKNADKDADAWANRAIVAKEFSSPPEALIILRQVHGIQILDAFGEDLKEAYNPHAPKEGDGLVSSKKDRLLGVTTADCAPLLIADPNARIVGAAHAGWRGALDGVGDSLVDEMEAKGADRRSMVAAIGPCIAQASYEVDRAFEARFVNQDQANTQHFIFNTVTGKPHFDLSGYLGQRLRNYGLGNIEALGIDTLENHEDYFSYRRSCLRQEGHFGLQVSVITLT